MTPEFCLMFQAAKIISRRIQAYLYVQELYVTLALHEPRRSFRRARRVTFHFSVFRGCLSSRVETLASLAPGFEGSSEARAAWKSPPVAPVLDRGRQRIAY